jgi:hypothetical protein
LRRVDVGEVDDEATVVTGCYPAPVIEPAEHDLVAVAALVAAAVEVDLFLAAFSARDADPYRFVFQRFPIPIGTILPGYQEPWS